MFYSSATRPSQALVHCITYHCRLSSCQLQQQLPLHVASGWSSFEACAAPQQMACVEYMSCIKRVHGVNVMMTGSGEVVPCACKQADCCDSLPHFCIFCLLQVHHPSGSLTQTTTCTQVGTLDNQGCVCFPKDSVFWYSQSTRQAKAHTHLTAYCQAQHENPTQGGCRRHVAPPLSFWDLPAMTRSCMLH